MRAKGWIALLSLFIVVGCVSDVTMDSLYEHHPIQQADLEKISEDEFLVYFYSETCQYCKEFAPTISDYVNNGKLPIYMFDIYGQGQPLRDEVRSFLTEEGVERVPTLIQYKREQNELKKVWTNTGVINYDEIGIEETS